MGDRGMLTGLAAVEHPVTPQEQSRAQPRLQAFSLIRMMKAQPAPDTGCVAVIEVVPVSVEV
jgi:hypothetical protein